jgi:hypothetical protein
MSSTLSSLCLDTIHDVLLHRPNDCKHLRAAYVQATRARIQQGCRNPVLVKAVAQHLWNDSSRHDALHYYRMLPGDPEALQLLARVAEARTWCLAHVEVVVGLEWDQAGSSSCLARWGVRFAGTPGVYLADSGVAELSDRSWDTLSDVPETRLRWLLERTPGAQCQLYASTLPAGEHGLADMEAFMKYEALKSIIGEEIDDRHGYRVEMPSIDDLVAALQGVRIDSELVSLHNAWKLIEFVHDSVYVAASRRGGSDRAVDVLLTGSRLDMSQMLVEPAAGMRIRELSGDMLTAWMAARRLFHKL